MVSTKNLSPDVSHYSLCKRSLVISIYHHLTLLYLSTSGGNSFVDTDNFCEVLKILAMKPNEEVKDLGSTMFLSLFVFSLGAL